MQSFERFAATNLGQHCYDKLVVQGDFFNAHCLKLVASKFIGYGIVAGSMFYKVPQIAKIVQGRSVEGLSFVSFFLETVGFTISALFGWVSGLPISTYGETISAVIQNWAILALMVALGGRPSGALSLALAAYAGAVALAVSGFLDLRLAELLQQVSIPLFIACRLPQIWQNWRAKSTGQLSVVTVLLQLFGSLGRIFTTIQETSSTVMLTGFIIGSFLNTLLATQFLLYRGATVKKEGKGSPARDARKMRKAE